jgi:hypothetical protein
MSNPLVESDERSVSALLFRQRAPEQRSESPSQNQEHHAKGRVGDDIPRPEMMEITRWENEGGRIGPAGAAHQHIGTARKSRRGMVHAVCSALANWTISRTAVPFGAAVEPGCAFPRSQNDVCEFDAGFDRWGETIAT